METDSNIEKLLKEFEYLKLIVKDNSKQRVLCEITRHELPCSVNAIVSHIKSKKFQKAKDWYTYDYTKYEPYIVPHRRKPKSLYCNVTHQVLNRIPQEIEKHVNGKKYKRLFDSIPSKLKEETKETNDNEFDADVFEFHHGQLIHSDEETLEDVDNPNDDEENIDNMGQTDGETSKTSETIDIVKNDASITQNVKASNPLNEDEDDSELEHFVDAPENNNVNSKTLTNQTPPTTQTKKRKKKRSNKSMKKQCKA